VNLTSFALQAVQVRLIGHSYVEAMVLAILLGMAVGTLWQPTERWRTGIAFSGKQLLEVAVMLPVHPLVSRRHRSSDIVVRRAANLVSPSFGSFQKLVFYISWLVPL
jgi:hypothetical protein